MFFFYELFGLLFLFFSFMHGRALTPLGLYNSMGKCGYLIRCRPFFFVFRYFSSFCKQPFPLSISYVFSV